MSRKRARTGAVTRGEHGVISKSETPENKAVGPVSKRVKMAVGFFWLSRGAVEYGVSQHETHALLDQDTSGTDSFGNSCRGYGQREMHSRPLSFVPGS